MIANIPWALCARLLLNLTLHIDYLLKSSQPPIVANAIITPILLMRILSPGGIKWLAHQYSARKWLSWELNPISLATKLTLRAGQQ